MSAKRHESDRQWFETHKQDHQKHVAAPFADLILELKGSLSGRLPGIDFSPKKMSKPTRRVGDELVEAVVRSNATAHFAEPAKSMFEMNPGIYISLGAADEDNLYAVGLYTPSGRQFRLLRPKLVSDFKTIDGHLNSWDVVRRWGGLGGERYIRFPRGFDENAPGAQYLWHKQFFLRKQLSRATVMDKGFVQQAVEYFSAAIPFLEWVRATVGVYRKEAATLQRETWGG